MKELPEKHRSLFFALLKSKWSIKICKVAVIFSKIVEDNSQILEFLEHWWLKKDELSRDLSPILMKYYNVIERGPDSIPT